VLEVAHRAGDVGGRVAREQQPPQRDRPQDDLRGAARRRAGQDVVELDGDRLDRVRAVAEELPRREVERGRERERRLALDVAAAHDRRAVAVLVAQRPVDEGQDRFARRRGAQGVLHFQRDLVALELRRPA
jgi:hypothetical protein